VPDLKIAAWATRLGPPHTETRRSSLTVTAGEAAVLTLPGGGVVALTVVRAVPAGADELVSLRVSAGDWAAYRAMSLWLFHTPSGAVPALPDGVPVIAAAR